MNEDGYDNNGLGGVASDEARVTRASHQAPAGLGHSVSVPNAARFTAAIGEGSRTFRIAAKLGLTTAQARYRLKKLEREGIVKRDARHTYDNDIYWVQA